MSSPTPTADGARISALVGPVVTAAGYDLEQVSISKVGRRSIVRVVVDADGGVSLDGVALVSRVVSAALDTDGFGGTGPAADGPGSAHAPSYTLEVSSPGVDRPLTEPRHWRRAVGRLVRTTAGDRAVEGRVAAADGDGVVLDVAGASRSVPYSLLGKGSVQVEFTRREGGE